MTPGNEARNLVLTGFMGTGKSTVGRLLARQLDMDFVDTDAAVENEAGMRIPAIFRTAGEAGFRVLEARVCQQLAAGKGRVIATGGGALLDAETRAAFLANSMVVCLTCNLRVIVERVGADPSRPLYSNDVSRLAERLAQRRVFYDSLPHQVDTTYLSVQATAEKVIELWKRQLSR